MRINEVIPAGGSIRRPVTGRYMFVRRADDIIELSARSIEPIEVGQGETADFDKLGFSADMVIKNPSNSAVLVDLQFNDYKLSGNDKNVTITNDAANPARVALDEEQLAIGVNQSQIADAVNELGEIEVLAGETKKLLDANPNRLVARVFAGERNLFNLMLGYSDQAATTGLPLGTSPAKAIDKSKLAIWAHNPNDHAQHLRVVEEVIAS